jgi:hypothetical protein
LELFADARLNSKPFGVHTTPERGADLALSSPAISLRSALAASRRAWGPSGATSLHDPGFRV